MTPGQIRLLQLNDVRLVGRLTRDPEVRYSAGGMAIANLRIATSERRKDGNGGWQDATEWHTVVIFSEPICKVAEQYLRKGSKVYIEGGLQTRKWTDKDGKDRYSTEVVLQAYGGVMTMLDGKSDNAPPSRVAGENDDMNDEVPF